MAAPGRVGVIADDTLQGHLLAGAIKGQGYRVVVNTDPEHLEDRWLAADALDLWVVDLSREDRWQRFLDGLLENAAAPLLFCDGQAPARTADHYPRWERRLMTKLVGYIAKPSATLRDYPESDRTVPALYARAYAYHKEARIDAALAETDALIATDPDNPYFLELRGQVLLESGRPDEALPALRRATELTNSSPLIASMFGHALIATENAERIVALRDGAERFAVANGREIEVEMPEGWSVRSRCIPDYDKQQAKIMKSLEGLETGV